MGATINDFLKGPLSTRPEKWPDIKEALKNLVRDNSNWDSETSRQKKIQRFRLESREPLFDYQAEVVRSLRELLSDNKGQAMLSLPTGGGKTRTALWFYRSLVKCGLSRRMLWVAPSTELVEQAVSAMCQLWREYGDSPSVDIWVNSVGVSGNSGAVAGKAAFATTQLAARKLVGIKGFKPDLLIFDEAHQAAARTSHDIVHTVFNKLGGNIVGLSATPGRRVRDESDFLSEIFGRNLVVPKSLGPDPVTELRRRGVLAAIEYREIRVPDQWRHIKIDTLNKVSLSIDKLALNSARFWAAVGTIVEIASARKQCLVFGASVSHCFALAAAICVEGISVAVLSHKTSDTERVRVMQLFRAGAIDVLLNKNILAAGFDLPKLEDVVLTSPIRSPILWEQIVGRISRGPAVGGSATGRVWELDDHRNMHKQVMASQRFAGDVW